MEMEEYDEDVVYFIHSTISSDKCNYLENGGYLWKYHLMNELKKYSAGNLKKKMKSMLQVNMCQNYTKYL